VIVRDLQPKDRLSDLLGLASVHLLPQKAEAADLVLPSKLTNMLASGRPVVATAAAGTGLAREMEGCGIVTPPGDEVAFADAIETVLDQPLLADRYSRTARDRAERDWNKDRILASLYTDLEAAVTAKSHRRHGALR
jgi:colanic acid biosynthesis glycosyl transferase WcaI